MGIFVSVYHFMERNAILCLKWILHTKNFIAIKKKSKKCACMTKSTSSFEGIVEKEREKCYFDRAKHNSVNACAHVCNNVKREEGL